jgi:oxygen-independent coproporphyrinogen-3 oxidase
VSGIYIHIPFCRQACSYCDFHFSTNQSLRPALTEALCTEIEQRANEIQSPIQTLYFGGGSPSILNPSELQMIMKTLRQHLDLSGLTEVTLESNPDDHRPEQLDAWLEAGVDRLSIGIQSFHERDLQMMNRAHSAVEAARCVEIAQCAGFKHLSIDLIYGVPQQTLTEWENNVSQALGLGVDHISAYCLTVEERTALHHQVLKGRVHEKEDEQIEAEYLYLHTQLEHKGYAHYEISNFALAQHEAKHNSSYWDGAAYLGFGPGAHSFDGVNKRRWNVSNNPAYIKALKTGTLFHEGETLKASDLANERIMTGLRHRKGIDLRALDHNSRREVEQNIETLSDPFKAMLVRSEHHVKMKPEAWLMADAVVRELMLEG